MDNLLDGIALIVLYIQQGSKQEFLKTQSHVSSLQFWSVKKRVLSQSNDHYFYYLQHHMRAYTYRLSISYNMGKRDLPDIYALAGGPQARGRGHIYQANPDCPCYK